MLILIIILFIIYYFYYQKKVESFNLSKPIPDLVNYDLKDSLNMLNDFIRQYDKTENQINYAVDAVKNFNYFKYNISDKITLLIPTNNSLEKYFDYIFSSVDELKNNSNLVNNFFLLGNIYNKGCIMSNNMTNCGPFTEENLKIFSNFSLKNEDFIHSNIYYKFGIMNIVDFIFDSNKKNLKKNNFFIDFYKKELLES
mgnify:CR=1 FL=1